MRQGALVLRNTLPYMPPGVHVAVVDPQVGTERRALALRTERRADAGGPDNGLLSLAWERCGGVDMAVDVTPLAPPPRAGVGHLPRPGHLRSGRGAPGAGAELADAGEPLDPESCARSSCPSRATEDGGWWRTR